MKIFTLAVLLIFAGGTAVAQDTIPNPGFESWDFLGTYSDPSQWVTLNYLTGSLNVYTVTQDSTTAHSGRYSAKLITKSVSGHTAPGTLSSGKFDLNSYSFSGGFRVGSRPASLSGWYQYAPSGSDTASFNITLTKWNVAGDSEEVVGKGSSLILAAAGSWTQIAFNITYTSAAIPDSALILIFASNGAGQVGSVLHVDDVSYSYFPASIAQTENKVIGVYPNPANNQFMINNTEVHATTLNLYGVDGKLVKGYTLHDGVNTLSLSGISAGVYMIRATDNTGATYTNSLVVDK